MFDGGAGRLSGGGEPGSGGSGAGAAEAELGRFNNKGHRCSAVARFRRFGARSGRAGPGRLVGQSRNAAGFAARPGWTIIGTGKVFVAVTENSAPSGTEKPFWMMVIGA